MEQAIKTLFERYERAFRRSLAGAMDGAEVASLYASEFVAASPAGIMTGKNDGRLIEAMTQGYDRYRAIGTKDMGMRSLRLSAIDERHCVAHVGWTATYARNDLPETAIGFEVHYLVQVLGGDAKVFGWVSGDEEALLADHGIV